MTRIKTCIHEIHAVVRTLGGAMMCSGCGDTLANAPRTPAPPPVYDGAPNQVRKAARRTPASGQRLGVLKAIRDHGPMCAGEIAEYVRLSPNQTATRIGECRALRLLEWHGAIPCSTCDQTGRDGTRRCSTCKGAGGFGGHLGETPSGHKGMVWKLTKDGRNAAMIGGRGV